MEHTSGENEHLPIIDLSQIGPETGDRLVEAASKWGFLYIRNQGLGFDTAVMDRIFGLSGQFFKSPIEEKKAVTIGSDDKGWSPPYAEVLDPENQQQGDFKEFVVFTIWRSIDDAKGGKHWFSSRHDYSKGPSGTILRFNYYPYLGVETSGSLEDANGIIRGASHTDFGSMTLLFQRASQPGLEIQNPESSWSPVAVFPPGTENDALPPIVVNIGDLLNHWTNGLLKSTVHRVNIPKVNKEDRYSIAYFCHPIASTELIPIPSKIVSGMGNAIFQGEEVGATKKAMTAKEHLHNRLAAVYGWGKENSGEVA
ncbi:MAG: hypothetical protein MMC33_001942 [Icmadophila ericetorum]|nr:hypothetical protein [Icmadophila ericetorum]